MMAKFHFFVTIANLLQDFLKTFQSEMPLVPFMHQFVKKIMVDILEMIIAPSLITDSTSLADLMLLDLSEDKNFCTAKSIKLNFSNRQALRDAEVSEQSEIAFRCDVKTCLQSFLEKLKERSNLKHKLVSNLDCMNL